MVDEIAEFIRDSYSDKESGIVYCFSRKECEQVCVFCLFSVVNSFSSTVTNCLYVHLMLHAQIRRHLEIHNTGVISFDQIPF